jgi:hypothetical protein
LFWPKTALADTLCSRPPTKPQTSPPSTAQLLLDGLLYPLFRGDSTTWIRAESLFGALFFQDHMFLRFGPGARLYVGHDGYHTLPRKGIQRRGVTFEVYLPVAHQGGGYQMRSLGVSELMGGSTVVSVRYVLLSLKRIYKYLLVTTKCWHLDGWVSILQSGDICGI